LTISVRLCGTDCISIRGVCPPPRGREGVDVGTLLVGGGGSGGVLVAEGLEDFNIKGAIARPLLPTVDHGA